MDNSITFVLGGARSGKSALAERIIASRGLPKVYIATAQAWDAEMAGRIAEHVRQRGADWLTLDAPMDLPAAIAQAPGDAALLIDCLTLWLSNRMLAEQWDEADWLAVEAALTARTGPTVLVSNEVGLGIVPDTPLGRRFRDAQGRLNRAVAARADTVLFVAAGLPLALKGKLP